MPPKHKAGGCNCCDIPCRILYEQWSSGLTGWTEASGSWSHDPVFNLVSSSDTDAILVNDATSLSNRFGTYCIYNPSTPTPAKTPRMIIGYLDANNYVFGEHKAYEPSGVASFVLSIGKVVSGVETILCERTSTGGYGLAWFSAIAYDGEKIIFGIGSAFESRVRIGTGSLAYLTASSIFPGTQVGVGTGPLGTLSGGPGDPDLSFSAFSGFKSTYPYGSDCIEALNCCGECYEDTTMQVEITGTSSGGSPFDELIGTYVLLKGSGGTCTWLRSFTAAYPYSYNKTITLTYLTNGTTTTVWLRVIIYGWHYYAGSWHVNPETWFGVADDPDITIPCTDLADEIPYSYTVKGLDQPDLVATITAL